MYQSVAQYVVLNYKVLYYILYIISYNIYV